MGDPDQIGPGWYFTRKEIEENSPSRRDGIDLKRETYLRKSYCTFLQELGMRLKVPQVTIATAIVFCHQFFIRQSHAKNDRRTIATVCMFLAGKVEETPHALKDVIIVSYEIIHKRNQSAAHRIKQKEVYEQQKELILLGERLVLVTLNFNLNVVQPYRPLVQAIKKFKVAEHALAQAAWNFVNDGLRTSLCLQFKPHHIAAGAIFLAAKFIKVKLPSDGDRAWWQEFDVTPRQLEEVSNQMLELYDRSTVQTSNPPGAEPSTGGGGTSRPTATTSTASEHPRSVSARSQAVEIIDPKVAAMDLADSRVGSKRSSENQIRDYTQDGDLHHTTDHRKTDSFLRGGGPFTCNSENTTLVTSAVSSLEQPERGPAISEKGSRFHEAMKGVDSAVDAFIYVGDNQGKSGIEKRRKTGHNATVETEHEAVSAMHGIKAHDVESRSVFVTNCELES